MPSPSSEPLCSSGWAGPGGGQLGPDRASAGSGSWVRGAGQQGALCVPLRDSSALSCQQSWEARRQGAGLPVGLGSEPGAGYPICGPLPFSCPTAALPISAQPAGARGPVVAASAAGEVGLCWGSVSMQEVSWGWAEVAQF